MAFTQHDDEKRRRLLGELNRLVTKHALTCKDYARILAATGYLPGKGLDLHNLPWLPTRLFSERDLWSIDGPPPKVITSSGTTGNPSRIYLDRATAAAQLDGLTSAMRPVLGSTRLPMLIVDAEPTTTHIHTARTAGALGLSFLGRNHAYVLDSNGRPNVEVIRRFLAEHGNAPFAIFGFTFMVWLHLYEVARDSGLSLANGILIHSGGWKKLADRAVTGSEFRARLAADIGLQQIYNFYGYAEQLGTPFIEGDEGDGTLYVPDRAYVIIRDPRTWEPLPIGRPGILQTLSTIPGSYPGHSLLTEDLARIEGIDDGSRPGQRVTILGRLARAEARGCSDTYAGGDAA